MRSRRIAARGRNYGGARALTNAAWSGNVATFTAAAAHGLQPGDHVNIQSVNPIGYNGGFAVASAPSGTTFTVALSPNPGSYTNGGTYTR